MIKHSKGEWVKWANRICDKYYSALAVCQNEGDQDLFFIARSAPHECDDPQCPGNINRRKLALWDEMVEALRKATYSWHPDRPCEFTDKADEGCHLCAQAEVLWNAKARDILTKAEAINQKEKE